MACDLITEMALITVVSVADRRDETEGMRPVTRVASPVTMLHTPGTLGKKNRRLNDHELFSCAHIILA